MLKSWIFICCLLSTFFFNIFPLQAADLRILLVRIRGTVLVRPQGQSDWIPGALWMELGERSAVKTLAGASADILFAGRALVRLRENSEAGLSLLDRKVAEAFRTAGGAAVPPDRGTLIRMQRGLALVLVGKQFAGLPLVIETPIGMAGVSGTRFVVDFSASDRCIVAVAEGRVIAWHSGQPGAAVQVGPGRIVHIQRIFMPFPSRDMTGGEKERYRELRELNLGLDASHQFSDPAGRYRGHFSRGYAPGLFSDGDSMGIPRPGPAAGGLLNREQSPAGSSSSAAVLSSMGGMDSHSSMSGHDSMGSRTMDSSTTMMTPATASSAGMTTTRGPAVSSDRGAGSAVNRSTTVPAMDRKISSLQPMKRTTGQKKETLFRVAAASRRLQVLLLAAVVFSSVFAAGILLVAREREQYGRGAVAGMAELLTRLQPDREALREFGRQPLPGSVRVAVFDRDLKQVGGAAVTMGPALRDDLQLAVRTGYRVCGSGGTYEVVPGKDRTLLVMITGDPAAGLLSRYWPVPTGAFVLLLGAALFFAGQRKTKQQYPPAECLGFLQRFTGENGEHSPARLVARAEQRRVELEEELQQCGRQVDALAKKNSSLEQLLRKTRQDLEVTRDHLLRAGTLTALGEFSAGISHELNNPLGIVHGFAQYLLDETPEDHPHHKKLSRMETELERCQHILQDLLAFARPAEARLRPVDINELLTDTLQFAFYPPVPGIDVVCHLQEDLPQVKVDPDQLEQVLLNLLKNGVQAMTDGGTMTVVTTATELSSEDAVQLAAPVVQPGTLLMDESGPVLSQRLPRVEEQLRAGDSAVRIEIRDMGPGIEPQDLQHIFTPFFTTRKQGTGLGLSISWKLIRRNGGLLQVDSTPGQGTTFSILFPFRERADYET